MADRFKKISFSVKPEKSITSLCDGYVIAFHENIWRKAEEKIIFGSSGRKKTRTYTLA